MDDISFYNIIELEKPKGQDQKNDIKQCRFWLKVDLMELREELKKVLSAQ